MDRFNCVCGRPRVGSQSHFCVWCAHPVSECECEHVSVEEIRKLRSLLHETQPLDETTAYGGVRQDYVHFANVQLHTKVEQAPKVGALRFTSDEFKMFLEND